MFADSRRPLTNRLLSVCVACACTALAACATIGLQREQVSPAVPSEDVVAPLPAPAPAQEKLIRETGIAGWYGKEYHGRPTAAGVIFDMNDLTAAHRTFPLGTLIRVTNLDNSKSIDVTVTHRGPSSGNRLIDLSYGAARGLGFLEQGTAHVSIEAAEEAAAAAYTVLAAAYLEEENARMLKERLSKKFEVIVIVPVETNFARFYRVQVGSYASMERAQQVAEKLVREGLEPVVMKKD